MLEDRDHVSRELAEKLVERRRRNLEDINYHARWEALMARRLRKRWFEMRNK